MRTLAAIAALGLSSVALGATVTIDRPHQGLTTSSNGRVPVVVSVSYDFVPGQDGWVQLWVDGTFAMDLKGTDGVLSLAPGNHHIQARLVTIYYEPLRVPANSSLVRVTVPSMDPNGR